MTQTSTCPACHAAVEPSHKSCFNCGADLAQAAPPSPAAQPTIARLQSLQEKQTHRRKIHSGRGAIMAVAILTFLGGIVLFFIGQNQIETEVAKVEKQIASFTPEQHARFEESIQAKSGMSWAKAVSSSRGQVRMTLATNMALAVMYFGLWLWAKKNALGAALVACIVYMTVIVASAIVDPSSLGQGIVMKGFIVVALVSAVSSAYKFRRLEPAAQG
jgi:hypothetical protein